MITAMLVVAAVLAACSLGLMRSLTELRASSQSAAVQQAFHVADAALAAGLVDFRAQVLAQTSDAAWGANGPCPAAPATLGTPPWQAAQFDTQGVPTAGYCIAPLDVEQPFTEAVSLEYSARRPFVIVGRGVTTTPPATRTLVQVVQRVTTPLFQFVAFYDDDLEINPGAPMTLTGKIFTNGDLYLRPLLGSSLTIDSPLVASAGRFYGQVSKISSRDPGGDVRIRDAATNALVSVPQGPFDPTYVDGSGNPRTVMLDSRSTVDGSGNPITWQQKAQELWGGTIKTQEHGTTQRQMLPIGSIQPGGEYNAQAQTCGVEIKHTGGQNEVWVAGARQLSWEVGPTAILEPDSTFPDYRERKAGKPDVTVTNVAVDALNANLAGDAHLFGACPGGFNGVVYATRPASAAAPNAIRLKDGAVFNQKITFVTNNPVYIQGNFNCGSADCSSGSRQGVAVLADALTILSANWDAHAQQANFANRPAINTTVNAAFIAGIVETTGATGYSGGFENYPRLLEHWAGDTLTMKGSFIQAWQSAIANAPRESPGPPHYHHPNRNWSFDANFLDSNSLPPLAPTTRETRLMAWWECQAGDPAPCP